MKSLLVLNVIILTLISMVTAWLYILHTDIAATKNEHLYREKVEEIKSIDDVARLQNKYVSLLAKNLMYRRLHNEGVHTIIYFQLAAILLLCLNIGTLFYLRSKNDKKKI